MAYEYCNVKMFPQNHEHNICTFSIVTQRNRGCKHVVNSLRICGIESVIEKTTGVDCERKNACYINETCYVRVTNSNYNRINKKELTENNCENLIKRLNKVT